MPVRVFIDNEVHLLQIELYEGPAVQAKVVATKEVPLPKESAVTKYIAPYFYPTNNCPDEGTIYLFDNIHNQWGKTKITANKDILVEPISWFPL